MKLSKGKKYTLWLAGGFLLLACIFQFALIGYQTMVLLCLGLSLYSFLWGLLPYRWFHRLLAGAAVVGVLVIAAIEVPIVAASRGDEQADAPYVIVLGAGVNGDVPSLSLQNRLLAAQRWLTNHPDSKAILSGGQGPGENISEAQCMYQWLTQYGIAGERLLLEDQSRSTRENFKYSAALLQADNGGVLPDQVAVISSEYHLYRASLLAEQVGIHMIGVPAKTTLPVLRINYFLREAAAVGRLWVFGY